MKKDIEAARQELVRAFEARRSALLREMQADFGPVVQDLRLFGSVLDPKRFRRGSDVDVAVIVADDMPRQVRKLHDEIFGRNYLLCVAFQGEPFALDPITMGETEWPVWKRGTA